MFFAHESANKLLDEITSKFGKKEACYEEAFIRVTQTEDDDDDRAGDIIGYYQSFWILTKQALVFMEASSNNVNYKLWIRDKIIYLEKTYDMQERHPREKLNKAMIKFANGEIVELKSPEEKYSDFMELVDKLI